MERHLGGAVQDHPRVLGVPLGHEAARLQRHGAVAMNAKGFAPHIGSVREHRLDVALVADQRGRVIGAGLLEQQHLAAARHMAIGNGRQSVDDNLDRLQRVLRERRAIGENDRERLTHITHLLVGDHRLLERHIGGMRLHAQRNLRHRPADVGGGDDGMHPGHRQRRLDIDGPEPAMRHRTAQDDGMNQIFAPEIAHIDAATAQESQIFHALDGSADERIDRPHAGASPDPGLGWTERTSIIGWRL